ncbi:MAG: DNA gyrase subunit A, partial [Candidatus Marsarchaeota archaeon]|nr:DNA gyrase subunit A [Candidatus Marsarchaeota archaeon]
LLHQIYVLNLLYKHTQLQITSPVMNIAVLNNALLTMNIKQFIKVFVDHRFDVITKRTIYDLNVAKDRMHIVKGLVIAMENIDDVVSLIKASHDTKDARSALMEKYVLSEKQASAILDMKLSRLTSLEVSSLKTEERNLEIKIEELTSILSDNLKVYHIIKDETLHIKNTYGIERKTKIEVSELPPTIENEDLIEDMDITILLTNNNYLKRMNMKSYKVQDRGGRGVKAIELKEGDFAKQTLYCKNKDTLMVFSNIGRAYWIKAYMVPEGDRYSSGKAAINLIKMRDGEHIERVINTKEFIGRFITFVTSKGVIKRVRGEKFAKPRSNGINAIPLRDGDSLADVCISNGESQIFLSTKNGKSIRFNESDIRLMSRMAHGIRGIRLKDKDSVVNIISVSEKDYVMSITEKGYGKITELDKYRLQYRGGGGVLNIKISDKTGMVVKSLKVSDNDTALLISSNGISIQFPVSSVRKTGRAASGVRIMRLEAKNSVVDAQIISPELVDPNQNAIIESDSNEVDGNI